MFTVIILIIGLVSALAGLLGLMLLIDRYTTQQPEK